MTICLLGASFSTNNMGVSALAAGAIRATVTHFPDAEMVLLDYGKKGLRGTCRVDGVDIPFRLINMRFSMKLWLKNHILTLLTLALICRLLPSRRLRKRLLERNRWLSEVLRADIVGSLAGGDSFSDIYGIERFVYVSLPQLLVLALGKPLVLLPQTLGPFRGRLARLVGSFILSRTTLIYSRDWEGVRRVRTMLRDSDSSKVHFCYDVGFVLEPHPPNHGNIAGLFPANGTPVVGLNVSSLLFHGEKDRFGIQINYPNLVKRVIALFVEEYAARVVLIPHVFGETENPASEPAVCLGLWNELHPAYRDQISVVQGRYSHDEIKHVIGRCDFFVGSRMHACIAALSQEVPAVSIAYSQKFIGVVSSLGMDELVADACSLSEDAILNRIRHAYENRELLQQKLRRKIPEVKSAVLGLFKDIQGRTNAEGSVEHTLAISEAKLG